MAPQKNQVDGQGPSDAEIISDENKKAEKKVRKERKNKAFAFLKTIADSEGADPKIAAALKVVRPSLYGERTGGGGGKTPLHSLFVAKVVESGKEGYSELQAFQDFKIGRREANSLKKKNLKSTEPDERIWINFDKDQAVYKVVGKGSTPPRSYVGYIPIDEELELK